MMCGAAGLSVKRSDIIPEQVADQGVRWTIKEAERVNAPPREFWLSAPVRLDAAWLLFAFRFRARTVATFLARRAAEATTFATFSTGTTETTALAAGAAHAFTTLATHATTHHFT